MRRSLSTAALAVLALWPVAARAGEVIRVTDPRYFQTAHPVVFPGAEIKLVQVQFEGVPGDSNGKQITKQLHDAYLAQIQGLAGGAIVTYVIPDGQQVSSFRVEAEKVATQQIASMALWGRVVTDKSGETLVAARLSLVRTPPGVEARYQVMPSVGHGRAPAEVQGVIAAPVTQARIDFAPIRGDVMALVPFLSGLAYYYKGASREGADALPWLRQSANRLGSYVAQVPEAVDAAAVSQAHLFLARVFLRLARASPATASANLQEAGRHAADAARLNPYDASVPPVRAVVAQLAGGPGPVVRQFLADAVRLAPSDTTAQLNLAMVEAAMGHNDTALKTLNHAKDVARIQGKSESNDHRQVAEQLRRYGGP